MSEKSSKELIELFARAIELPAENRGAFLDAECGQDLSLQHQLQLLVQAHEASDSFMAPPKSAGAPADRPANQQRPTLQVSFAGGALLHEGPGTLA